jgi:F-type H+-transporting ATPase subunit c
MRRNSVFCSEVAAQYRVFGILGGKFLEGVARQPELTSMLMMRMFLMAGLVDAFAAISIVMGLYLFFANNPFASQLIAAAGVN